MIMLTQSASYDLMKIRKTMIPVKYGSTAKKVIEFPGRQIFSLKYRNTGRSALFSRNQSQDFPGCFY